MREPGLFPGLYPSIFKVMRASCCKIEMSVVATIVAFAFREVNEGPLTTIDGKQSLKMSVFGTERMYFFLPVLLNHLSTAIRLI